MGNKGASSKKAGAGGKAAGAAKTKITPSSEIEAVYKATTIPAGTYLDSNGEEFKVEYKYPNEYAIEMYVDGESRGVISMPQSGVYRADEFTGMKELKEYKNMKSAIRHAFGTKKEWDFKKKIK